LIEAYNIPSEKIALVYQGTDQKVYEEFYPLYRDLYPALKPTFTKVAA